MSNKPFFTQRYFLQSLDPIHIGTGGMRLGRVDLSIVREPGTRLPKIPGTSLNGAVRYYAAYRYGKRPCAGQGQAREGRKGHCGWPTCRICYTFGYFKGKEEGNAGVVSIGDARILFFPVYSMYGPVWVSTLDILKEAGFKPELPECAGVEAFTTMANGDVKPVNLGWLMVKAKEGLTIKDGDKKDLSLGDFWGSIKGRLVMVSDQLFSQVVNSNLEVRTSVSINPETGAAEEGALFTYEAIPRTTFFWLDVVVDDYRGTFPGKERLEKWLKKEEKDFSCDEVPNRDSLGKAGWEDKQVEEELNLVQIGNTPLEVISAGLGWAEHLGIGGMGTRGFGRVRLVAAGSVKPDNTVIWEKTNASIGDECTGKSTGGEGQS